ncbi:WcaI family glycosyltransferase, partial [Thalassorhabdomicrobium marinisediminis]
MKFQILGINYAPELISTAVYTTDMAEYLSRAGHEVNVVTAQPYFPAWEVMEGWPKYQYKREQRNGINVVHCPLYVPRKPTGKSRLLHYATFTLAAFPPMLWRALTRRPDVVFVVAPSLVSAVAGWVSARLSGAKLWVHVQDFEVEAGFATGAFSPDSRIGRAARAFEGWMLRRCDRVSSISAPMVRKLVAKGVDPTRTFELRNWANLDHVDVVTGPNPARDRLGITTRYVALYSGNVAAKQGIEIIPQAARLLHDRDDLTFLICGQGPLLDTLKAQAADLPNVRFAPLQPIEHFSETLGLADVHLLPQIEGVSDLLLPSKLTNMLASGRPVIATVTRDTALAAEVEGAGVITPPGDAPALAAALTELLQDPERHARLSRQARSRALDRWNKPAILDRFLAAAKALISAPA